MSKSRRQFLAQTSIGLIGAAASLSSLAQEPTTPPPAGMPPAFGTGPAVGSDVSAATFAEAEKLVQIKMTFDELTVAADTWRVNMASVMERRSGPRKIALASVARECSEPGTQLDMELTVEAVRHRAGVKVHELPFFNPPRKTATPV